MTINTTWSLITLVTAALAFAGGAGWQYLRAERIETQLAAARRQLTFQRLENTLAAASLEAQLGRHESARQLTSTFFSSLQADVDRAPQSARLAFREILAQRDSAITALSRGDPQSGALLIQLLGRYREGLGLQVPRETGATPTRAAVPRAPVVTPADTTVPADTAR